MIGQGEKNYSGLGTEGRDGIDEEVGVEGVWLLAIILGKKAKTPGIRSGLVSFPQGGERRGREGEERGLELKKKGPQR